MFQSNRMTGSFWAPVRIQFNTKRNTIRSHKNYDSMKFQKTFQSKFNDVPQHVPIQKNDWELQGPNKKYNSIQWKIQINLIRNTYRYKKKYNSIQSETQFNPIRNTMQNKPTTRSNPIEWLGATGRPLSAAAASYWVGSLAIGYHLPARVRNTNQFDKKYIPIQEEILSRKPCNWLSPAC